MVLAMAISCKTKLLLLLVSGSIFLLGHAIRSNAQIISSATTTDYKATYNGLIYPEDGLIPEHYGFFRIKVSSAGAFSGQIQVGQKHAKFVGHFNSFDSATVKVKVFGPEDCPWNYYLGECIEPDPDSGQVIWIIYLPLTNGRETLDGRADFQRGAGWSARLSGVKAGYNRLTDPAPQAGQYSFILMGSDDPQNAPAGECYGTLKVDTSGNVKLTGTLANGA